MLQIKAVGLLILQSDNAFPCLVEYKNLDQQSDNDCNPTLINLLKINSFTDRLN